MSDYEMENEEITREKADSMLLEWAEWLDLDPESNLFKNLREELNFVVRTKKLAYDVDNDFFKYKLLKPVDGIDMVEIRESDFKSKKALDRYKESESIMAAMKMMSMYTNLTYQQVEQLKDRDVNRINAVILGFLSQTPQLRG